MVRLQHRFVEFLQFVGIEVNLVLVVLEDTIVPGIHKLVVAILPKNITSEVDGIGNLGFSLGVIDNIGRTTTNVHHGNGLNILECRFRSEVVVRSLRFSIAFQLLLCRVKIKDIGGFLLPNLLEVTTNAFLKAERTEPDYLGAGDDAVLLEDVSLDEKQNFADKHPQILFILCPLDVCNDSLVAGTTELLVEESDIAVVEKDRFPGIIAGYTESRANREPVGLIVNKRRNKLRFDQRLECFRNLSFNPGDKALLDGFFLGV